jgi:type I restriction enzyme R subunit
MANKTVKLFEFGNPENNDFLVTNQFQLDGLKLPIYSRIVIFVNGIPFVLIECKSPYIRDPILEAVGKNFERYESTGTGPDRLMFFNHLLIGTRGTVTRHSTIGSDVNYYARWSEAYPIRLEDIKKTCRRKPRKQEIFIVGVLSKSHLLDLLKNFTIYETVNNRRTKKTCKASTIQSSNKGNGQTGYGILLQYSLPLC